MGCSLRVRRVWRLRLWLLLGEERRGDGTLWSRREGVGMVCKQSPACVRCWHKSSSSFSTNRWHQPGNPSHIIYLFRFSVRFFVVAILGMWICCSPSTEVIPAPAPPALVSPRSRLSPAPRRALSPVLTPPMAPALERSICTYWLKLRRDVNRF